MTTEPQLSEQQAFLQAAKAELGLEWDDLAKRAGIAPRALKTYRMPVTSKDHRTMPSLARAAIELALKNHRRKMKRTR